MNTTCPLSLISRLAAGMKARVLSNLNLRSSPDITNNLIRTSRAGTTLDGQTGWPAEGSLAASYYFLEPVK